MQNQKRAIEIMHLLCLLISLKITNTLCDATVKRNYALTLLVNFLEDH